MPDYLTTTRNPPHFFDLLPEEFDQLAATWGWPRFRARQVRDWVYRKQVLDPGRMSNLSKQDRQTLAESVRFDYGTVTRRQDSADGTIKLLITWPGEGAEAAAETVMIPDGPRRTACVSSQVGCPVGCKFCASGVGGVKGNLTAGQIVEQVIKLNGVMGEAGKPPTQPKSPGKPSAGSSAGGLTITNIVFMGMGEPMSNYANVMKAIRILHHPECLNLGARRITISTVGVPVRIRDLAKEELPLNLALSLHAPNEPLRRELIPWADHFALPEILDACRYYFEQTGREITLEYILLAGVNDRPEHARELARLCRTMRANVNLIRYNEVAGMPYKRPKADDVVRFQEILRANGVNAHVRKSRGRDIDAACGQLRKKEQRGELVDVTVAGR